MDLLGQRQKAMVTALGGQPDEDPLDPAKAIAGNAGIAPGEMDPNTGKLPNVLPPIDGAPTAPVAPTQDFGRLMGADAGKLNDQNKHDFKYDTMRTLSQFDPRQGVTPDVLAALNKLDYGTFSGSGDKLGLTGAKNSPDAADFAPQDWIYAHKANSDATKWNFGGGGAAPQDAGAPAGGGAPLAGGANAGLAGAQNNLDSLLQGNPQQSIQDALAALTQGGNRPNLAGLIASLSGGR